MSKLILAKFLLNVVSWRLEKTDKIKALVKPGLVKIMKTFLTNCKKCYFFLFFQPVVVSQEQDFFLLEMVAEAPQQEDDKNAIKERKVLKRSSSLSRVEDNLRMKRTFF